MVRAKAHATEEGAEPEPGRAKGWGPKTTVVVDGGKVQSTQNGPKVTHAGALPYPACRRRSQHNRAPRAHGNDSQTSRPGDDHVKKPRATVRGTDAANTADRCALGTCKDDGGMELVTRFLQEFFDSAKIARQVGQRSVRPLDTSHPSKTGLPTLPPSKCCKRPAGQITARACNNARQKAGCAGHAGDVIM